MPDVTTSLWSRVSRRSADECWPFCGAINGDGYGRLGSKGKMYQAHRLAYTLAVADPGELHVLHTCDNRRCCNPAHLYLGTDVENARDKVERGRTAKGTKNGRAKLCESDVLVIKSRLAQGESGRKIASIYGVSYSTINGIRRGEIWSHLAGMPFDQNNSGTTPGAER